MESNMLTIKDRHKKAIKLYFDKYNTETISAKQLNSIEIQVSIEHLEELINSKTDLLPSDITFIRKSMGITKENFINLSPQLLLKMLEEYQLNEPLIS